ncbi:MAG TPA: PAS domain S-box protein, partial [Methanoregulaceae archaeon]|nr:PAS domain S-box protein [Methanoregulaceae archaeon]
MSDTRVTETLTAGYSLLPLLAVIGTSLLCITVSIVSLMAGWFIIFQNLYYIPIIIACVFFRRQGFLFSALLAGVYLVLFATFTRDPSLLQQALIRVALFILIAGVITFLALARERTERALKESENKYRTLIANIPEVTYRCAPEDGTTMSFISDAVLPLTGYPASDFTGNAKRSFDSVIHPDDREKRAAAIQAGVSAKERYVAEYRLLHADGRTVSVQEQGQGVIDLHGTLISLDGIILDVTDRKQAEERERLHATRVRALLALHQMIGAPEKALLEYVMNTSLAITASRYSFIGLMSEDESAMTIHAWSPDAMADCTLIEKTIHFPIAGAGIWGECVRNRAPVIINDYSSPHPAKHGCPEGHVPIMRYLGIPIFEGIRIVAVLAVANKGEPYTDEDADMLLVLGNQMWEILHRKRTVQELRLKDFAIESSINAIALADTSGILTYVNPAFLRIGEYEKPADVLGRSAASFIREPAQAGEVIDALLEHGSWSGEVEAVKKDGSPVIVQVLANRILDPDGDTVALMVSLVDITKRREAEEALRLKDFAIESSLNAIAFTNTSGVITYVNPAFLRIFGYEHETDLLGRNAMDIWSGPDQAASIIPTLHDAGGWSGEVRAKRRDGSLLTIQVLANRILDSAGTPVATMGSFLDITDRVLTEKNLRTTKEYLENLIDHANAPIIVWNPDFRITRFNHAFEELTGIPVDEAVGSSLEVLFPEESRENSMDMIRAAKEGERWDVVEIPILNRSGQVRTVLW